MSDLAQGAVAAIGPLKWVLTAVLLMIALISWAAGRGVIPENGSVGLRIPPLQRSDAKWRAGHAAAVMPALVAFAVSLLCSIVGLFVAAAAWGVVVAFVGGFVWTIVAAIRAANAA